MDSDASTRTGQQPAAQHAHPCDGHRYLAALGIRPGARGTGLATELLAPFLYRAGQDNASCSFETSDRCNAAFYERLGFRTVTDDLALLRDGPVHVAMRREADLT